MKLARCMSVALWGLVMLLSAYSVCPVSARELPVRVAADPETTTPSNLGTLPDLVRVDRCDVRGPKTGWVRVVFSNQREVVADKVIFLVVYNGAERRIVDVGRFSTGVSIIHEFPTGFAYGTRGETSCSVLFVHFVDGSQWTSPR